MEPGFEQGTDSCLTQTGAQPASMGHEMHEGPEAKQELNLGQYTTKLGYEISSPSYTGLLQLMIPG